MVTEIFSIMVMWFVSDLLSPITVMPIHLHASKKKNIPCCYTPLRFVWTCPPVQTMANFLASSLYMKFLVLHASAEFSLKAPRLAI